MIPWITTYTFKYSTASKLIIIFWMAKCTGKCPITGKLPIACCNFKALFFSEFKEELYGYHYSAEQSTFISVFLFYYKSYYSDYSDYYSDIT